MVYIQLVVKCVHCLCGVDFVAGSYRFLLFLFLFSDTTNRTRLALGQLLCAPPHVLALPLSPKKSLW